MGKHWISAEGSVYSKDDLDALHGVWNKGVRARLDTLAQFLRADIGNAQTLGCDSNILAMFEGTLSMLEKYMREMEGGQDE